MGRWMVVWAVGSFLYGQADPAYEALDRAYKAVQIKNYDAAIEAFHAAARLSPNRADIRKNFAYTLLKVGETEAARDQFGEALRLEPADAHLAMEYAFLCYETRKPVEARRIFDRIRKSGNAAAEQAFENIDRPLREGIARWKSAIEANPNNFSGHEELASLAEQRDEFALAAQHYSAALALRPDMRVHLLSLGRVAKEAGDGEKAHAYLLAASRSPDARIAESAKELLPRRYPYVYEFRNAIALDPKNVELRRELAYLLLEMDNKPEAEKEFEIVHGMAPDDLLSAAQLGFLKLARKDGEGAMPLLERVLKGDDEELADKVRSALKMPQVLRRRGPDSRRRAADEARTLGERSFEKGYLNDALKYLSIAHEADPLDFNIMLKLGWTLNMLKRDGEAVHWFELASQSPDDQLSSEARRAYDNLRTGLARTHTTIWAFPLYSSRWKDLFSYAQIKTEFKLGNLPLRPYTSIRFIGNTRGSVGHVQPQLLSESAFVLAVGVATRYWKGLMAWGEAGTAAGYLTGRFLPDYRGGLSFSRGWGRLMGSEQKGWFVETNDDAVFVSRFGNDTLFYTQNRFGYTLPKNDATGFQLQLLWNANVTTDVKREQWANFGETGPGVRFRFDGMPKSLAFTVNTTRGVHLLGTRTGFRDVRAGVWWAR